MAVAPEREPRRGEWGGMVASRSVSSLLICLNPTQVFILFNNKSMEDIHF